jgi:hypothetical protein
MAANEDFTELSFVVVAFGEGGTSSDHQFEQDGVSHLVTGLQNNKTLKRFSFSACSMSDRDKSRIVTALEGHPTLEHLGFDISSSYESNNINKTPERLIHLLSLQTCNICSLELTGEVIDLGLMLELLQNNKSIKRLSLSDCDLHDGALSKLFKIVCQIQNLTHIDLSRNEISTFPSVLDHASDGFLKKLRVLDLEGNPIMKKKDSTKDQKALLQLLQSAPQLGYAVYPDATEQSDFVTPLIKHHLDWNRCGRILMTEHENEALPLSMWPLVFGRVNRILQKDRDLLLLKQPRHRIPLLDSPDPRPNALYQLFRSVHPHFLSCQR